MGIKYSNIDGVRNCEILNGILYLDTVGGRSKRTYQVPLFSNYISPYAASDALLRQRIIAECVCGEKLFVLYRNFHWNVVDVQNEILLDFGSIPAFNMSYSYYLVGSILHRNSYRAIYIDRTNKIGYIAENEKSACLRDFDPKGLVELAHANQALCLAKASDTPEVGYCGDIGNMFTVDFYSGEVTKYAGSH